MSDRGVFAIDRGIFDHPVLAGEPFTKMQAFMWMIGEAAWRPRRVRVGSAIVDLARGQLAYSLRFLAQKWGWTDSKVRRFIITLKTDAMIDAATDAGVTIITICNYSKYQRVSLPTDAAADAPIDAAPTQHRRKDKDIKNIEDNKKKDRGGSVGIVCPESFEPRPEDYDLGQSLGFDRDAVDRHAAEMRRWSEANAHRAVGRKAGLRGWHCAFESWMNRAAADRDSKQLKMTGGGSEWQRRKDETSALMREVREGGTNGRSSVGRAVAGVRSFADGAISASGGGGPKDLHAHSGARVLELPQARHRQVP